MNFRTLKMDKL